MSRSYVLTLCHHRNDYTVTTFSKEGLPVYLGTGTMALQGIEELLDCK